MVTFGPQEGDEAYLRWMEDNPRGYVIAKTCYHWAACLNITGYGTSESGQGPGCFTATVKNTKTCLTDKRELQETLQREGRDKKPCKTCEPGNPVPYADRKPRARNGLTKSIDRVIRFKHDQKSSS